MQLSPKLYLILSEAIQSSFLFLKNFSLYVKINPIKAGIAMFNIQSSELAENTITPKDEFMSLIINHFSKTNILTEPLTAISVIVIKGTIIIRRYVSEIGIMALK